MVRPLLEHYQDIVMNVKGNTGDGIHPQTEKEIENRLGVLPYRMEIFKNEQEQNTVATIV
jgi:adenylate kinase